MAIQFDPSSKNVFGSASKPAQTQKSMDAPIDFYQKGQTNYFSNPVANNDDSKKSGKSLLLDQWC